MQDLLSDVFDLVRLRACVYFQRDFHAPFGMRMPAGTAAQFHVFVAGTGVVSDANGPHEVSAGDVVVFPHGAAHAISDRAGRVMIDGPDVLASFGTKEPMFASGGTATRLICGHYEYDGAGRHALLVELPQMIHVRGIETGRFSRLRGVLDCIMDETARPAPGSRALSERLAEALLFLVLRAHFEQSGHQPGFAAGVADTRLSRAIAFVHREFSGAVALEDLAREAGMSRSSFAHRFKAVTGLAPVEYLTQWRMLNATRYLSQTEWPVSRVAESVGYESDIAFARAFRKCYQLSPSHFRRLHGARRPEIAGTS